MTTVVICILVLYSLTSNLLLARLKKHYEYERSINNILRIRIAKLSEKNTPYSENPTNHERNSHV